ncbi:MAG: SRPBCC family protein [Reyranella sp.]|nr:SRPBCC family protein [Reyranella sp.]
MLKTLGYGAAIIAVLVVGVLIYAASKPDSFRVQRSASIKAPPDKIFALINDLRAWNAWSPYEKKDPAMKRTFSGASSGKGAIYEWDGNNQVGKGRMEITETTPPGKILIKLDFIKPFEGHNTAEFTMEPKGDDTVVTWAMYGPAAFMTKLIGIFMNMDAMIGNDFAAGLANLKVVAEKK